MLLLLLLTTPGFGLQTPKIIQPGPKAGILLRDDPGFLVAEAQTITYQIYVSLDPLQVIQRAWIAYKEIWNTSENRSSSGNLPSRMRTTLEDTVLLVNLHSRLINSTITQVQILTNSLNEERTFREPVRLLTNDLLREIGLGINYLIQGRIPTYLVNETVISGILQKVSPDTVIDFLQVRIAYNMGAAVPLFVDVENMQVAIMVSLPFIRPENIYQLKAIINVRAWNGSYLTTVITPPVVAYQEKFTQYLVPNLKLCKKAKDLH
ncbi:hypothetical protein SKAU_G00209280 [Synaphobranchus kaupii]|uniref:Uncharacterized protein n=1 Tax=Synaphobranchus kaupii TaxID=118154 RepID=A0A9Q1F928_SYNKA|nr:hypothetical protein SKAU_G00209280 [Synaphobranchus kaupii]